MGARQDYIKIAFVRALNFLVSLGIKVILTKYQSDILVYYNGAQ